MGTQAACYVVLDDNGKGKRSPVAALVLKAFIGSQPDKPFVEHANNDPFDNRLSNIRWEKNSPAVQANYKGQGPCQLLKCKNTQKCKTRKMACESFKSFAISGTIRTPTEPSKAIYKTVFFEDADDIGNDQMQKTIKFEKFDAAKQITYGTVYSPLKIDSQGDFMTAAGIEKIAHGFVGDGLQKNIDTNHDGNMTGSTAVESFIAKGDKNYIDGSWVLGVKHPDAIWSLVKSGKITGYSMEGSGSRKPTVLKGQKANELVDVKVTNVSLTDRPANRTEFAVKKSGNATLDQSLAQLTAILAKQQKASPAPKAVSKTEDAERVRKAEQAAGLHRQIDHFNEQIFRLWESNPLPGQANREARLEDKIQDCEAQLVVLGVDPACDFDDHSAFGGTSSRSNISAAFDSAPLGVTGDYSNVSKASGPVGDNTLGVADDGRYDNLDDIDLSSGFKI